MMPCVPIQTILRLKLLTKIMNLWQVKVMPDSVGLHRFALKSARGNNK